VVLQRGLLAGNLGMVLTVSLMKNLLGRARRVCSCSADRIVIDGVLTFNTADARRMIAKTVERE
jgi:hypothetical protein